MVSEVTTLELKLDAHALPFSRIDLALGLAVGIPGLDCLDVISEFASHHSEEEDDALLVDRLVTKTPEVEGVPVGRAVVELAVKMMRR